MRYQCPVCLFPDLPYPPADYHICPSCGTEFGNDDSDFSHEQLRQMWIAEGAHWFFGRPPAHWNPWLQLIKGWRDPEYLPTIETKLMTPADIIARDLYYDLGEEMTVQFRS